MPESFFSERRSVYYESSCDLSMSSSVCVCGSSGDKYTCRSVQKKLLGMSSFVKMS